MVLPSLNSLFFLYNKCLRDFDTHHLLFGYTLKGFYCSTFYPVCVCVCVHLPFMVLSMTITHLFARGCACVRACVRVCAYTDTSALGNAASIISPLLNESLWVAERWGNIDDEATQCRGEGGTSGR